MRWIVAAVVLVAGAVLAGTLVDQGSPGFQGPWPVKVTNAAPAVIDGGYVQTQPKPCSSIVPKATAIGASPVQVPAVAAAGRLWIEVCNGLENGSTVQLKCLPDGTTPSFGAQSKGKELYVGDCVTYNTTTAADGGSNVICISNATDAGVESNECLP